VEQLAFSAGNPRVEHITGVVHLYRHLTDEGAGEAAAAAAAGAPPLARSRQVCVLALPPDMGFPEFCTFLGAYFERVRDIRLVRRDAAAQAACLVLLSFDAQDAADGFYDDFNTTPVSRGRAGEVRHSI
jgi:BRCA1-associated protein